MLASLEEGDLQQSAGKERVEEVRKVLIYVQVLTREGGVEVVEGWVMEWGRNSEERRWDNS